MVAASNARPGHSHPEGCSVDPRNQPRRPNFQRGDQLGRGPSRQRDDHPAQAGSQFRAFCDGWKIRARRHVLQPSAGGGSIHGWERGFTSGDGRRPRRECLLPIPSLPAFGSGRGVFGDVDGARVGRVCGDYPSFSSFWARPIPGGPRVRGRPRQQEAISCSCGTCRPTGIGAEHLRPLADTFCRHWRLPPLRSTQATACRGKLGIRPSSRPRW